MPKRHTGYTPGGSLWRRSEYPGYKNPGQAARGGTRRSVATARIKEAAGEALKTKKQKERERKRQERIDKANELKEAAQEKRDKAQAEKEEKQRKKEAAEQAKERKINQRELARLDRERRQEEARKKKERKEAAAEARRQRQLAKKKKLRGTAHHGDGAAGGQPGRDRAVDTHDRFGVIRCLRPSWLAVPAVPGRFQPERVDEVLKLSCCHWRVQDGR